VNFFTQNTVIPLLFHTDQKYRYELVRVVDIV
jgi:hypothetical protein